MEMSGLNIPKGTVVWTRGGGDYGITTGSMHKCMMEGCSGFRVTVKWDPFLGKRITHPCSKGMTQNTDGSWQIL